MIKSTKSRDSLQEIVQAYRTLLPQCHNDEAQEQFAALLDYCDKAVSLPLTQTALNGLRESLDQEWAGLTSSRQDNDDNDDDDVKKESCSVE